LRDECWLLNGRPEKGANSNDNVRPKTIKYTKSDKGKGDDSDNESEVTAKRTARPAKTLQVAHTDKIAQTNTDLDLIKISVKEAKKEISTMLMDTGATLTLIKLKHLKGETLIYDEKYTLIGAIGKKNGNFGDN